MTANPLKLVEPKTRYCSSAYTAAEWAQMALDKGNQALAKAWKDAERDGWDERCFSLSRRDDLAQKYPGSFAR